VCSDSVLCVCPAVAACSHIQDNNMAFISSKCYKMYAYSSIIVWSICVTKMKVLHKENEMCNIVAKVLCLLEFLTFWNYVAVSSNEFCFPNRWKRFYSIYRVSGLEVYKNTCLYFSRVQTERDGTRAETRFGLPAKTDESIYIGGGCQFSRVLAFLEWGSGENDCSNTGWTVPSQTENCWLPTPFASFPFTSPPVRHRVPSDSVSTLPS